MDAPAQVTVRVEIQDLGSGLAPESPWLDPVPLANYDIDPVAGQSLTLISGDHFKGTYETTFTFPERVLSGSCQFKQRIVYAAGNVYTPAQGDAIDSIGLYLNVASLEDKTPPTVRSSLSTKIVDITDGPAKTTITVNAEDRGIGISTDAAISIGASYSGSAFRNSSTNPSLGIFVGTFEHPSTALITRHGAHRPTGSSHSPMLMETAAAFPLALPISWPPGPCAGGGLT